MAIKGSTLVPKRKTKHEIFFLDDSSSSLVAGLRALIESGKSSELSDTAAAFEWREHGPSRKHVPLMVVANLDSLSGDWAQEIRKLNRVSTKFLLFAGKSPVQSLPERVSKLDVRDPHRMHISAAPNEKTQLELVARLVSGLGASGLDDGAASACILDAWWEGGELVLLSPMFDRLRVPRAKLAQLVSTRVHDSDTHWANFRIQRNGAYIHWPEDDIHMSWDGLAQLVDDSLRMKALQQESAFNRRYGSALRFVRKQSGLSQHQIAGLTDRHVRRIEAGEQRATSSALEAYASALGTELAALMADLAELVDRER